MSHGPRLTYRPALDGLRALAVGAVLLYHLPVGWAAGGWLGVSAFFVLSGYLITSLLLVEHDGTGRVDRLAFWARRFRRLLPASLACVAMVIAFVALDWLPRTPTLRGDLVAALLDVENWRVYATGGYEGLWRAPSPVAHFWSLAIEEQWYVVWPVAVGLLLAWSRKAFAVAVAIGIVGAFVSGVLVSPALAYLATFSRAAELLVGAGLALVLHRVKARPSPALTVAGFGALAAVLVAFAVLPLDWSPLFQGGLLAFAVVVAVLVTAAVTPGPVAAVLSVPPLVWLGLRSYGVYLYHWPLYLVFENQGWSTWWALVATLALADLSYRFLEQPVRKGVWPTPVRAKVLAPVAVAVVGVAALAVTPAPRGGGDVQVLANAAFSSTSATAPTLAPTTVAQRTTVAPGGGAATTTIAAVTSSAPPAVATTVTTVASTVAPTTTLPTSTVPPRPVRITVVGDSTAHALGKGVTDWATVTGRATVSMRTIDGCGLIREGSIRFGPRNTELDVPAGCADWATRWPRQLSADQAEVVVVTVGPWEWIPRRWNGSQGWVLPTDVAYQQKLAGELAAATDVLTADGRKVVWITGAPINPGWGATGSANADPSTDDAQRRASNEVLRQVSAGRPNVALVDLAAWVEGNPQIASDQGLRPDGVHWTEPAAQKLVEILMASALTAPAG